MADGELTRWIDRVPAWADWVVAIVAAIVVFNLNVTSAGDPLSGIRGVTDVPRRPGISESGRMLFYLAIAVAGATLAAGTLVVVVLGRGLAAHAVPALRSFGLLAAAGAAGLLLDYTDGPVRLVQLFVYVALILAVLRFIRLALGATPSPIRDDGWEAGSTE